MPRRDDTFIIYYAEDFTEYETSNPSNLYCLSQSSIDIILSALRFATWPTRWRTDRQDYRGKVSPTEWEGLRKWGELAIEEVIYEMGCDINEGLTNIANALTASANAQANAIAKLSNSVTVLANAQCCDLPMGGTGGVQGTVDTGDTGPIPIYGETPIDTGREPGTFPPEFEDEPSYLANKCAVANLIVDGVISTLHGFAAFTVFNATALVALIALATASIIIMPPVAIPVMVGCILALVGFTTYFEGMSGEIANRRQEYVCILYRGETIEVMISLLADFIDAVLSLLGGAGWVNRILKQVFLLLNNPDTLKQLFDGVAGAGYPDADCSDCECSESGDFTDLEHFEWEWTEGAGNATEINADGHWGGETFGGLSQWGGIVLNKEKPAGTVIDITYNFDCEAGVPLSSMGCYVEGFEGGAWVIEDIQTPGDCYNNTVHCDLDADATAIRVRFVVDGSTPVSWVVKSYSLACP